MVLLDVDRLREAMGVSRLTSYNGWNWASFDERDHIGDPSQPLRDRLRESAASADEVLPDGPIYLLTHLRYAGYVFNPISLYYCYDRSHRLRLVLADVRNTYGGRRSYWLRSGGERRDVVRDTAAKSLYVSPFMDYDVDYDFVLTPPGPSAGGAHERDAPQRWSRRRAPPIRCDAAVDATTVDRARRAHRACSLAVDDSEGDRAPFTGRRCACGSKVSPSYRHRKTGYDSAPFHRSLGRTAGARDARTYRPRPTDRPPRRRLTHVRRRGRIDGLGSDPRSPLLPAGDRRW